MSPLPVWVGESLAQYYGLKALAQSGLDPTAIEKVRSRYVDTARPVSVGLLELQRRHEKGDNAAYPLFYQQGATFWALVDEALSKATIGRRSLDDLMPQLLTAQFGAEGQLPKAFVDQIRAEAGVSIEPILSKYLGL